MQLFHEEQGKLSFYSVQISVQPTIPEPGKGKTGPAHSPKVSTFMFPIVPYVKMGHRHQYRPQLQQDLEPRQGRQQQLRDITSGHLDSVNHNGTSGSMSTGHQHGAW